MAISSKDMCCFSCPAGNEPPECNPRRLEAKHRPDQDVWFILAGAILKDLQVHGTHIVSGDGPYEQSSNPVAKRIPAWERLMSGKDNTIYLARRDNRMDRMNKEGRPGEAFWRSSASISDRLTAHGNRCG